MKKTDKAVLAEGFRRLSAVYADMADQLEGIADAPSKKPETPEPAPVPVAEEPVKAVTKEDVRLVLAEKSRSGYRAEVKALLTAHGADKLSAITDPEELAALAKEAEVIGSA